MGWQDGDDPSVLGANPVAQTSREIYWSAVLADFRRSGLTHVRFCQSRRISIHSFRAWLYRLRPGLPPRRSQTPAPAPDRAGTPAFLPVLVRPQSSEVVADPHIPPSHPTLELILGDRCRLRVPVGFDPATLDQLLDVLERRP